MKLIIVGGGKVAAHLLEVMPLTNRSSIVVIEQQEMVAYRLADHHDIQVINGNGSDVRELEKAGAKSAKMVIALTGHDETNLIVCQLAKLHFNVPLTVARVNNAANMQVFKQLGVDHIYCGTKLLADIIDRAIQYKGMRLAYDMPDQQMGIVEFYLRADAKAVGQTLATYTMPANAKVVLMTKTTGAVELPSGDSLLCAGDKLLVICPADEYEEIWKRLVDQERQI